MMDLKTIAVITPTYNRKQNLEKLYHSLEKQTLFDFEWYIIDDGSSDQTEELISEFIKKSPFPIHYFYKENGGKHTALNFGIKKINNYLTLIVDSDDELTEDAIDSILKTKEKIIKENLAGVVFLKGYSTTDVVGTNFEHINEISNLLEVNTKMGNTGDKCEVWRTDLLKANPFPEFPNEKFIGESVVWNKISKQYNMLYQNKIIYLCEYLEGGLSKQGRLLRIKNPNGGMENSKTYFHSNKVSLKYKIKNIWLFICYGKFAKLSWKEIITRSTVPFLCIINIPFGYLLYLYWKNKYQR